jgi:hypothetical protein
MSTGNRQSISLIALAAIGIISCGCQSQEFAWPHVIEPGTAKVKQSQAARFDPYPEPDTAPYADGSRPRGFLAPRTEMKRARTIRKSPSDPGPWDLPR